MLFHTVFFFSDVIVVENFVNKTSLFFTTNITSVLESSSVQFGFLFVVFSFSTEESIFV